MHPSKLDKMKLHNLSAKKWMGLLEGASNAKSKLVKTNVQPLTLEDITPRKEMLPMRGKEKKNTREKQIHLAAGKSITERSLHAIHLLC